MPTKNTPIYLVDGLPARLSGPWIRRKHYYLRRYLDIFTRAMQRKWSSSLTYIDLFAGPGRCFIDSIRNGTEGSPLIALAYPFSKYIFIEENSVNLDALAKRCGNSPKSPRISFISGDCNDVVSSIQPAGLSVAFADPTGLDLHFETIRKLTEGRKVDLLLNIQFGIDLKRNFVPYRKDRSPLDQFLGGSVDWRQVNEPRDAIDWFRRKIEGLGYSTAKFKVEVRNQKNVPMYFLFFASKHPRGLYFWREITKKDEAGQHEWAF